MFVAGRGSMATMEANAGRAGRCFRTGTHGGTETDVALDASPPRLKLTSLGGFRTSYLTMWP